MPKVNSQKLIVKRGFTLIEILFVIIIIGIIASIILVMINSSKERSRVARLLKYGDSVRAQLSSYEVGWWRFEESSCSGDCVKDSWGGNNLTPINGIQFGRTGIGKGNAFYFNGSVYIEKTSASNLPKGNNAFTIAAWINPSVIANLRCFVGWGNGGYGQNSSLCISGSSKKIIHYFFNGGTSLAGTTMLNANEWYYVVATYNGTARKLYLNGLEEGSDNPTPNVTESTLRIGVDADANYLGFNGLIDEVQIWSSALTAMDVQRIYAESAPRHGIALK